MTDDAKRDELVRFLATFAEWLEGREPIADLARAETDSVFSLLAHMKQAAMFMAEWDTMALQVQAAGGVPADWGA